MRKLIQFFSRNKLTTEGAESRYPNFRNLGIILRTIIIVGSLMIIVAILLSNDLLGFIQVLALLASEVQPTLVISLVLLYIIQPQLKKLSYYGACLIVIGITLFSTLITLLILDTYFMIDRVALSISPYLVTLLTTLSILYYFNLFQRAHSPAVTEARLQALQARIRPHFLFNSINAVLSLIRSQPKLAETALENMAELFRVLMANNRDLVPLTQEIKLSMQYLAIEKLRLNERLQVTWRTDKITKNMLENVLIPPLILQPLLENAIHHGIEPLTTNGEILVSIYANATEVIINISNPYLMKNIHHDGNNMALNNIRERLLLHFDLEASLQAGIKDDRYEVNIEIPKPSK